MNQRSTEMPVRHRVAGKPAADGPGAPVGASALPLGMPMPAGTRTGGPVAVRLRAGH